MNDLGKRLSAEMKGARFADMSVAEQYNFVSEFVMREYRGEIEAAREKMGREKCAYYFSAEFLMGRLIYSNLLNLGILTEVKEAMAENGVDIAVFEEIPDHALGNGGLGRLAACFLDSAATVGVPLHGYGIRYRYGFFRQDLSQGYQRELPDDWSRVGDPWSLRREEDAVSVTLSGKTVRAIPYDLPVIGYGTSIHNETLSSCDGRKNSSDATRCLGAGPAGVRILRLWQAEAESPMDFSLFDAGKYLPAVAEAEWASRITAVLYPNDNTREGKELRLRQQYFFTDASVEDILRRFEKSHGKEYARLPDFCRIQLNDTHPVWAIPALILRLEDRGVPFRDAFPIVRAIFAYTNHTVMQEALEVWEADLVRAVCPAAFAVIELIQAELEREMAQRHAVRDPLNIVTGDRIHMARLESYVGYAINGVAALHTEILRRDVLRPWYDLYPDKFQNKTNGITQRRWLLLANPRLSSFITERIGEDWITEGEDLTRLRPFAEEGDSLAEFARIKAANKERLSGEIARRCGIKLDPTMLFDIQIKRLHEYKRQLMNALSIVWLYQGIKGGEITDFTPTAFLFGAKSAPGYARAKGIIRYILAVADLIEKDPAVRDLIKVVFIPDYNVSWAEGLVAAGDLSEQISKACTEASGTGNMKFMLNGAPTLGTYDGANIEILEASGAENNYFFGPDAQQMRRRMENYDPRAVYTADPRLARAVDTLIDGTFVDQGGVFAELYASLLDGASWHRADNYCVLGDFADYTEAKLRANRDYRDTLAYAKRGLINTASAGRFSADRTVREYAEDIWGV
ncbi:MAG: glycogen/starch/alpha-glucan family phosphorylase [Clostridia bacterium]|nr:glycogen/starch/alpha-glucan family phosphorylase [Clostridia bacterium]